MRKTTLVIFLLLILVATVYFLLSERKEKSEPSKEIQVDRSGCLSDDEVADYPITEKSNSVLRIPKEGPFTISVRDKNTLKEKFKFTITNLVPNHYHSVEIRKCGVYAIREFNYDIKMRRSTPNYSVNLWKYDYFGNESRILIFSETDSIGKYIPHYNDDFRIDTQEKYLVLERGYLGKDNYALVVKDLKTKEDVFELPIKKIIEEHPTIVGNFDMRDWSKDGRYFLGAIFEGAYVNGFFRIDTTNWKVDIFEAPQDVLGGDPLNPNTGYITVHPGNVWFGIAEFTQEEKEKRRKQGIGTELYIHNLITGERHFVDKTNEPLWYFEPKWFSDTELEYTLPTGEKKIYIVK